MAIEYERVSRMSRLANTHNDSSGERRDSERTQPGQWHSRHYVTVCRTETFLSCFANMPRAEAVAWTIEGFGADSEASSN
jgi:hypothetical protein